MADPPRYPDTGDDTSVRPTADRPPSTPRWVKVFGSAVILFLLAVGAFFLAGGDHGGEGHGAGDDNPGAVEGATAPDVQVPAGLQVATSGYTLSPISVPESAGEAGTLSFSVLGPDSEPVTEFIETELGEELTLARSLWPA